MPNLENIEKWIKALESRNYKQGDGVLHRVRPDGTSEFCCLGVACEVAIADGLELTKTLRTETSGYSGYRYNSSTAYLPYKVMKWLGVDSDNPRVSKDGTKATAANDDDHWSFEKIAQELRELYNISREEPNA